MNLSHNPSPEAISIESRITLIEFKAALNSLNGKTPGLDRISYLMIKNFSQPLTSRLINLYNKILDSHIPQQFKNSIIIPIHKPNAPKTSVTSYRPISLNPINQKPHFNYYRPLYNGIPQGSPQSQALSTKLIPLKYLALPN